MKQFFLFLFLAPCFLFGQASYNMTLLGNVDIPGLPVRFGAAYNDCWGYRHANGTEIAIIGGTEDILFVNITNPTTPYILYTHHVTNIPSGTNQSLWRDFQTYQQYVYAVSDEGTAGLLIFDMSNVPTSISLVYQSDEFFTQAHTIFIDEGDGKVYAGGTDINTLGVTILSLQNPIAPTLVGMIPLNAFGGGYVHEVYARNGIAYCSHIFEGNLIIYNFNNLPNVSVVGVIDNYPGQGYNHSSWLDAAGHYLLMTDETHGSPVKLIDVSNPDDISADDIHTFSNQLIPGAPANIAHNPFIYGNYAYLSYYHDGVQVFDISNPANITLAAYYDTYPQNVNYDNYEGCWGMYPFFQSGNLIASDMTNGLFILHMETGPLAIRFIEFDAVRYPSFVELNWTIADPSPGNEFEIQRSDDGGKTFTTIGHSVFQDGQASYRYRDLAVSEYRQYIYRIAFVQSDGKLIYSPLQSVRTVDNEKVINVLNPMQNDLVLDLNETVRQMELTLYDIQGRLVWRDSVEQGEGRMEFNLPWLVAGSYLLTMHWQGGSQNVMLQKVR